MVTAMVITTVMVMGMIIIRSNGLEWISLEFSV